MSTVSIPNAVERLLRGRIGPERMMPLTDATPGLGLAEAYDIQRSLEQAVVARGERVIGWKVGFTGAAAQEAYGVTEPVAGFMLASGVFSSGDAVPAARFVGLGVEAEVAFLLKADLAGVTFHVGSQCLNPDNWRVGMERARKVFAGMRTAGLRPRLLNLGGGYPVRHVKPMPSIETIAEVINRELRHFGPEIQVIAEPGRFLVSDAGYFICRVVGTATRNDQHWMYWDAGVFGGVIETTEGLRYNIYTDRDGEPVAWNVAGPTCDSVDVVMRDELLPGDLQEGDFIFIKNAGAYTTAYASNFNGFPLPDVATLGS
jgi:hypothetical protein